MKCVCMVCNLICDCSSSVRVLFRRRAALIMFDICLDLCVLLFLIFVCDD